MEKIRLLVISNNSLSENSSNGRTLAGFLRGWDKDSIAQIYITEELPSSEVCDRFFRITDKEVLKGLISNHRIGSLVQNVNDERSRLNPVRVKKRVWKMVLRDLLWGCGRWFNERLKSWLDEFAPQIILFFAGESEFTYKITNKIADRYNIPIVMYNCESYYLMDKNYLNNDKTIFMPSLYSAFHKHFKKVFEKMAERSSHIIYINDSLKAAHDIFFDCPSSVIYTASDVQYKCSDSNRQIPIISYLGNLGVRRHETLVEIADALYEIDSNYRLDIYGNIPNDEVRGTFEKCKGIRYKGFIPYSDVLKVMYESDLLVHSETFDEFYKIYLKYAFTTKIADTLSCGTCFFIYAPADIACVKYLEQNKCACVVTDKLKLKAELKKVLSDRNLRREYAERAYDVAKKNHNSDSNCRKFREILKSSIIKK